jgi:hypothetical protein
LRFAAAGMRHLLLFAVIGLATLLLAGCGEHGDKAIAYGDELGQEWKPAAGVQQMRISVENSFTRKIVVFADSPQAHYELTVGPIRDRHMIVPAGTYEITAFTEGKSVGMTKLWVNPDDRNGAKGLLVKIRP